MADETETIEGLERLAEAVKHGKTADDLAAHLQENLLYIQRLQQHMRSRFAEVHDAKTTLHAARLQLNAQRRKIKVDTADLERRESDLKQQKADLEAMRTVLTEEQAEYARAEELRRKHAMQVQTQSESLLDRADRIAQAEAEMAARSSDLDKRETLIKKTQRDLILRYAAVEKNDKEMKTRHAELVRAGEQIKHGREALDNTRRKMEEQAAELATRAQTVAQAERSITADRQAAAKARKEVEAILAEAKKTEQSLDAQRQQVVHRREQLRKQKDLLQRQASAMSGHYASPVKRPVVASLIMFRPDGQKVEIPLAKNLTLIGRGPECDIRIPTQNISRRHCSVELIGRQLLLRDLQSHNGTLLNQKPVETAELADGDTIAVGPVLFSVAMHGA